MKRVDSIWASLGKKELHNIWDRNWNGLSRDDEYKLKSNVPMQGVEKIQGGGAQKKTNDTS